MRWLSCLEPNHAARPVLLCQLCRVCLSLENVPEPNPSWARPAPRLSSSWREFHCLSCSSCVVCAEVQLGSCSQPFLRMELPFQNCRCFVGLGVRCEHQQVPLVSFVSHCLLGSMNKNDTKIIFQKSEGENLDSLNLKQPLHNQ